ncbi:MAG: hypothetical protein NPIRA03_34080 [Nitrospirales bacterium]|nr:MAG: hypothetical protein NPIRA03_34080 [Nitrospirales bacterium]
MGEMSRRDISRARFGFFILQIGLLIWAGWVNQDWISTDGISYIRIAQYYASGQFDLAISGYWGPMLSWIMVPLLGFVEEPLSAAQMAMALSAIVYLAGCMAIFRNLGIGSSGVLVALGIVAFFSVHWAVQAITPDLLMSGILCLAISRTLHPDWCDKPSVQFSAGLLFGAAYLAKAPGLPFAFLLIMAAGLLWTVSQQISPMRALRSATISFLGLMLIAGPWILVLSLKYEKLVFSTSAGISHAVMGPPGVGRGHPTFSDFVIPDQGRLSSWEDPISNKYSHWNPLESTENLRHQLRIFHGNVIKTIRLLKNFDWLGIGLVSVIFGFLFHTPWTQNIRSDRWRWAAIFIGCLVVIFLPGYGGEKRYYYSVYPFLLGGGLGYVRHLANSRSGQEKILHIMALVLVSFSFLFPLVNQSFFPQRPSYQAAKILKEKLNDLHISGPIASTSRLENIDAYTAFLMQVPYHGRSERSQTVNEVESSLAKIIIVDRGTLADENLHKDMSFISLDEKMFDSLGKDSYSGVKVYINTNI